MLALRYPDLSPALWAHPIGLQVIHLAGEERPKLIVKAVKECLLTARVNRGFKIYLVPVLLRGIPVQTLVSAFFDDDDNPYTLRTALCKDPLSKALIKAILSARIDVHLFDELGRELLSYEATVRVPDQSLKLLKSMVLLPMGGPEIRSVLGQAETAFGMRTAADDEEAISVDFGEPLFPEDIFFQNLRPEHHAYHGNPGHSHTTLVRDVPGAQQERDIVRLLERTFQSEQIYLGPLRTTDKKEFADVVVIGDHNLLIVQAKDSPNTEETLRNSLERKRLAAKKSLGKALMQVRGAARYARSRTHLHLLVDGQEVALDVAHLRLTGLVILREMFNNDYDEYSPPIFKAALEMEAPCIALDYGELANYTANLYGEAAFFEAYDRVFNFGIEHGQLPRLRVRPPDEIDGTSG